MVGNRRQGAREGSLEPAGRADEERPPARRAALRGRPGGPGAAPGREGRALVFGTGEGGFSGWSKGKAALDARIAASRAKAAGRAKPSAEDALAPWRLHDLRRSVVTHMAEIGIQPHVIEAVVNHISGHKGRGGRRLQPGDLRGREAGGAAGVGRPSRPSAWPGERKVIPMRA